MNNSKRRAASRGGELLIRRSEIQQEMDRRVERQYQQEGRVKRQYQHEGRVKRQYDQETMLALIRAFLKPGRTQWFLDLTYGADNEQLGVNSAMRKEMTRACRCYLDRLEKSKFGMKR